jgi:hypothetical protein
VHLEAERVLQVVARLLMLQAGHHGRAVTRVTNLIRAPYSPLKRQQGRLP